MRIGRNLNEYDEFNDFFARIAAHLLVDFQSILNRGQGAPLGSAGPLEFLAELTRRVRDPILARDVITALVRRGHIARNFGIRGLGARLQEATLLERSGHNLYRIAPRYRNAVRLLNATDGTWLDFSQAEVQ